MNPTDTNTADEAYTPQLAMFRAAAARFKDAEQLDGVTPFGWFLAGMGALDIAAPFTTDPARAAYDNFMDVHLPETQGWRAPEWFIAGYAAAARSRAALVRGLVAAADKVEHEKFCRRRWPTMNVRVCTCVRKDLDAALEAFSREVHAS